MTDECFGDTDPVRRRPRLRRVGDDSPTASADELDVGVLDARAAELRDAITSEIRGRSTAEAREARHFAALWEVCAERVERRSLGSDFEHGLELELRHMAMVIGIETNLSDRTIRHRIDESYSLVHGYPTVLDALERGDITGRHARVIAIESEPLTEPELRAEYLERALELAMATTPGRLEGRLRRLVAELDRSAAAERLAIERTRRCVTVTDRPNGMSELTAFLPSPVAHAIHDRLTELAKSDRPIDAFGRPAPTPRTCPICEDGFVPIDGSGRSLVEASNPDADAEWATCPNCIGRVETGGRRPELGAGRTTPRSSWPRNADASGVCGDGELEAVPADPRTFDAVRADALAELLLAGLLPEDSRHAAINAMQGTVAITVPALALAGATDEFAMQDGVGPIDLDLAMRLTAGATIWQRVVTDPVSGVPLAAGTYRPPAALARFVETRDRHCRAPGCRRPAQRCDLDHTTAHAEGGPTSAGNLAALCRYHHVAKHHRWRVAQGENGQLTWTSPTGTTCIDAPEPLGSPMRLDEVQHLIEHAESPPPRRRGDPPRDGPTFLPKAA